MTGDGWVCPPSGMWGPQTTKFPEGSRFPKSSVLLEAFTPSFDQVPWLLVAHQMPGARPLLGMPSTLGSGLNSGRAIRKLYPSLPWCFPHSSRSREGGSWYPAFHLWPSARAQEMANRYFVERVNRWKQLRFRLVMFRLGAWECEWDAQNLLITFSARFFFFLKLLSKRHLMDRSAPAANALPSLFPRVGGV